MKKDLTKQLAKKYPKLFHYYLNPSRTRYPIGLGLECGEGWYQIIDEALEKLSKIDEVVLFQIKEKFGGLRIYVGDKPSEHNKEIGDIIHAAEEKAWKTCEYCGKPGKTKGGGWILTLCDECEEKRKARK